HLSDISVYTGLVVPRLRSRNLYRMHLRPNGIEDLSHYPIYVVLITIQRCDSDLAPVCINCPEECLHPITRFDPMELKKAIDKATLILGEEEKLAEKPLEDLYAPQSTEAIYFTHSSMKSSEFEQAWANGLPIVVSGVQIEVGPEYFIKRFPEMRVDLEDCDTGERMLRKPTVSEFLRDFGRSIDPDKTWKLKDWPPKALFRTTFYHLFRAFMDVIPCPDMCRSDGIKNLAAHMPTEVGPMPDLGPKAYIAQGTKQDDEHSGSTVLHMDSTSAINVMVWSADIGPGIPGYATWHIFPAVASDALRQFLTVDMGHPFTSDPIHSQTVCMTPSSLRKLFESRGVRPYTILQYTGDAVFIPAGCAHQVSNAADAIKIAYDFVDVDNLAKTQALASEFRLHRIATGNGDDVLQLYNTLWHAWCSLVEKEEN
ncbi:hypothetical protein HWV62_4521, partial [Athelia sp. TMB]